MRILHLIPTLSAGGAETFVADLAIAEKSMGHDVDVFLLAGARGPRGAALNAALNRASVRCFNGTARNPRDPRNALCLLRLLIFGRYDVVHAHLYSVELVLASLKPLLFVIGVRPLLVRTLHNSNIYGTRSRRGAKLLARVFDWNFACGKKVYDNYSRLFGDSRVSAIDNGVSIREAQGNGRDASIRQNLDLPPGSFVVTCIGAFRGSTLATSQKAQDIAIRAFQAAFETDKTSHLLLVGDGELRAEAQALVHELDMDDNVHFFGNVASVHGILIDSDLLLMPSRYEGLPIVGLEAGCAGVPTLASSIDELLDVGGPLGWVFSKDNSVEDFALCLSSIRKDAAAFKRRAKEMSVRFRARYGMENCAHEYLTQTRALLDREPRVRRDNISTAYHK